MELGHLLPILLGAAWLLPLASFTLIALVGPRMGKAGYLASYVATGAIVTGFLLSFIALIGWVATAAPIAAVHELETGAPDEVSIPRATPFQQVADHKAEHGDTQATAHHEHVPRTFTGTLYTLGEFGKLKITISYYIDALTVAMFAMVTLIASCIHFYAIGYMHDELHDVTDHEVTLSDGHHLHRRGRFHRFFQYLSLFCFSMLGLVYAGNIAMVFVFWELVGICSYFLIGFYIERKSASNAANKAFIVNRVGDFGMIIGLMAFWAGLGTFSFGDVDGQPGMFSQVRPADQHYQMTVPEGMLRSAAANEIAAVVLDHGGNLENAESEIEAREGEWRQSGMGYWLMIIGGIGIFCGCVGKSAQFPLHVWLPDAMEGPTPVSALVHSATMVAAGVYLAGRFYPMFVPEVLLVIAYVGGITLFIAATIAITAVDIKRVLAYSTVSQLGYMMLALGIGGWTAGLFHLVTHAFFKSLLFMCSGSVIHACHTNDMTRMGGLLKKMPWTGYTMLVGCLAIIGAGIPLVVGFSGYYSKDAIIAQAMSFMRSNPTHGTILFCVAAGGAAITAFYMFRLWYLTFIGEPRDHHVHDHAHESPKVMYLPLVVLSVFAIGAGWNLPGFGVPNLLEQARPAGVMVDRTAPFVGAVVQTLVYPAEHVSHEFHVIAAMIAFLTAAAGFLLATVVYAWRLLDPAEVRQQFGAVYKFLWNKWYFDELYGALFVQPVLFISNQIAKFDRRVIDRFIDSLGRGVCGISRLDDMIDRYLIDGVVNVAAGWIFSVGRSLRSVQTGSLRQYVMFIVVGAVGLTVIIRWAAAGGP